MKQRLNEALSAEARDFGVFLYLLVVPSLPKNTLAPFSKRVAAEWTKDSFGGVIVFDDSTGQVSIEQSELAAKRSYEFELSTLLKNSMRASKRPKLSRDGLEYTTTSVLKALHEFKHRADQEDRDSRNRRIGLSALALVAVILGAAEYYRRRSKLKEVETPSTETVNSANL